MTESSGSREEPSPGEILSELAHDLRNFLEGLDQTMLARPELADEPELRDVVYREILALVLRTERHSDDFSANRSRRAGRRERLELRSLCETTLRGLSAFLRNRKVSVQVPESLFVSAKRAILCRALANACYAVCRSTADTAPLRIVTSQDGGPCLAIVIEGEECLEPEERELRLEELDVYDRVLKRQEGSLRYERDGSVVRVTLRPPRIEVGENEREQGEGALIASRGSRVLVVDDNEDAARSLAVLLEIEGYRTEVQFDGRSALEAARSRTPDVVLLDLGLPDLDGFEVCGSLRETESTKRARIVAVSGFGDEDASRRIEDAGFDDHLLKPVDPLDLHRALGVRRAGPERRLPRA